MMRTFAPILATAMCLMFMTSDVGAQFFRDDFDDGSVTDGNPVSWIVPNWIPNGEMQLEDSSLVLTPSDVPPSLPGYDPAWTEIDAVAEGVNLQDFSLRTQVRGLIPTNQRFWVGISVRDTLTLESVTGSTVYAAIGSDGVLGLGYTVDNSVSGPGSSGEYGRVATGLDFTAEDINLQFDVQDRQIHFTAWSAGEEKPVAPQISATVASSLVLEGGIALWVFPQSGNWNHPVAFRYVEVAAVPEPNTIGLLALGAIALGFRTRRRRSH